jgi:hypothetical protein
MTKITRYSEVHSSCNYFKVQSLCKDKQDNMYNNHEKKKDYKGVTGNNKDYFCLFPKTRKELTLLANFSSVHFNVIDEIQ